MERGRFRADHHTGYHAFEHAACHGAQHYATVDDAQHHAAIYLPGQYHTTANSSRRRGTALRPARCYAAREYRNAAIIDDYTRHHHAEYYHAAIYRAIQHRSRQRYHTGYHLAVRHHPSVDRSYNPDRPERRSTYNYSGQPATRLKPEQQRAQNHYPRFNDPARTGAAKHDNTIFNRARQLNHARQNSVRKRLKEMNQLV